MPDAIIIFAGEKEAAGRRLGDALSDLGYSVGSDRPRRPDESDQDYVLDNVRAAKATLVIWSKASMESETVRAAVEEARRRGTLVEISADGIAPVANLARSGIALISGWRGEPYHPGWQKIVAEVERLCGPPNKAPAAEPAPEPTAAGRPAAAAAAAPRGGSRPLALIAGLAALLLVAAAVASWISRSPPQGAETASVPPAAPAPAAPVEQESSVPPTSSPPEATSAPRTDQTNEDRAARPEEEGVRRPNRPTTRDNSRNMRLFCEGAGRSTRECREFRRRAQRETKGGASARERTTRREPAVRYRNDRNMRLFCEGAGRGTSQCRTYLRRTGDRD